MCNTFFIGKHQLYIFGQWIYAILCSIQFLTDKNDNEKYIVATGRKYYGIILLICEIVSSCIISSNYPLVYEYVCYIMLYTVSFHHITMEFLNVVWNYEIMFSYQRPVVIKTIFASTLFQFTNYLVDLRIFFFIRLYMEMNKLIYWKAFRLCLGREWKYVVLCSVEEIIWQKKW